ncbi:hypothetical protein SBI67_28445 [Mycolicibacterium sp. 120266]|uniref:hypothetical protein n=1 Tax=Mycolicibacterium sp. 120266 TaxID=3090601 RepID=UPI00299D85BC|nr:hypothetical protein [Mycolicibacterium sp. 120266]MDX1876068.1 hypothetical protein [Mycolicibacterium sp. 120266]
MIRAARSPGSLAQSGEYGDGCAQALSVIAAEALQSALDDAAASRQEVLDGLGTIGGQFNT